jgi:uncharacterized protein YidB (DUF937 family)
MGLFDTIVGAVISNKMGAQDDMLQSVIGMVSNAEGGLSGLLQKFEASGLKDQVASWVGTGSNLPISAEHIQSALGSSAVQEIAAKLGIDSSAAAASLASLLPQVVDKLTPDGQLPSSNNVGQLLSSLSGMFGNKSA